MLARKLSVRSWRSRSTIQRNGAKATVAIAEWAIPRCPYPTGLPDAQLVPKFQARSARRESRAVEIRLVSCLPLTLALRAFPLPCRRGEFSTSSLTCRGEGQPSSKGSAG